MGNGITTVNYETGDKLIIESKKEVLGVVKSGEGTFVRGQVFKFDSGSMQLVKTTATAGFVRVALEAGDATSAAVTVNMLAEGTVNGFGIVGIDYIVSTDEMATPDAPVTALVAGGTLTAATHEYKAVATNDNGKTAPSAASTAVTTHVATAGKATSEDAYADIAAVNTILGDCSVTNKYTTLNVDGTLYTITWNANYTGAGALVNWAALIAKLDTAKSTTAGSDGNKIVITSDTTGTSSKVIVVSDGSGLMGTAVEVAGTAIEKTVKITLPEVTGSTGFVLWRSVGSAAYTYRTVTAAEIALGYVLDDGSLTWAAGTAVAATDFASLQLAENHNLYVDEVISGYEFRTVD